MKTRYSLVNICRSLLAMSLMLVGLSHAIGQTPTVTTNNNAVTVLSDHSFYFPGQPISVSFKNGPGNSKDWIGIYPEGIVPGSVGSTLWLYVDNTTQGRSGLREGTVTFPAGLNLAGIWKAYLLLNDGYSIAAETQLEIIDPSMTLIQTDKRNYLLNEAIQVAFTNAPGNAKDWIGIYFEGQTPGGGAASTLWAYLDGTQSGSTPKFEGVVKFATGLSKPGNYVVFLLQNDGYNVVVRETISVSESTATEIRLFSVSPSDNATGLPPAIVFNANFTNTAKIVTNSIDLTVDNQSVNPTAVIDNNSIRIAFTNTALFAPKSTHVYRLVFSDSSRFYTNTWSYTVADYQEIILPQPIYFESFDNIPEGQLPSGWTEKSYTDATNPEVDFGNLDSAAYAKWTVVNAERFSSPFTTYSNPDAPEADKNDYKRVISINPLIVVNGKLYAEPMAKGRFLFSNSGYRNGRSQVDYVFTKDFNLSGQKEIYLSYHSLWEQNQDSMAAVEYSIDGGQNWLPVVYMLDQPDVLTATNATGVVGTDAVATFTTQRSDIAVYTDENGAELGGTYGAFIAAPISQDLAPFISPRVNDNPVESKRIELFRIDKADNQSRVRFRFAHAGTDSWYFGIDDFGLYSISKSVAVPVISISKTGDSVLISWPADAAGFVLESTASLASPQWQAVSGVSNNSVTLKIGQTQYFRLRK